MRELKQSTSANVMVFMVESSDHITGSEGLTLAIEASKDGGAFSIITPTVTERGDGWYNLALTTSHTNTLGDLAIRISGSGADPTDMLIRIIAMDKAVANTPANIIEAAGTAWNSGAITANTIATNAIDADALSADAIAEINATVDQALSDYDGPTRAEATADKDEILAWQTANFVIDVTAKTKTIYDTDEVTPLATFDLIGEDPLNPTARRLQ